MSGYIEGKTNSKQYSLIPTCYDEMIVEHIFGTIKRDLGYTHLLLRGNEKVKGETYMHFLIYNIKRVCNIKKIKGIIEAIRVKQKEIITSNFVTKFFFSNSFEERVAEDGDPYIIFKNLYLIFGQPAGSFFQIY